MPLEESYLAVHWSEYKGHRFWPSQRFIFLADLAEVYLLSTPSLVEIRDLLAIEPSFFFLESHKIRLRQLVELP